MSLPPIFLTHHSEVLSSPTQGVIIHPGRQQQFLFLTFSVKTGRGTNEYIMTPVHLWLSSLTPVRQKQAGDALINYGRSPIARTCRYDEEGFHFFFFLKAYHLQLLEGAEKKTFKCLREKKPSKKNSLESISLPFLQQIEI